MSNLKDIVMIIDKEDSIHDWILYDFARRKRLPLRTIGADKKELRRMRYTSIVDRREVVYVKDEDKNILKHYQELLRVNTHKRVLIIAAKSKELKSRIEKDFRSKRIIKFPVLITYAQKREYVLKVLKRWEVVCQNQEVERALVRNMVRDVTSWEEVKLVWDVYGYRGKKIDMETIGEIYPDEEYYNLDKFIFNILQGKWKKKGIKTCHYFLEVREYSPRWLLQKIQEVYLNLGLFYQAYRGGVLIMPESENGVKDRVEGLGWDTGLRLTEFKDFEQELYLEVVKEMSYVHYVKITKYVMGKEGRVKKEDLYQMIENIKDVRREINDS